MEHFCTKNLISQNHHKVLPIGCELWQNWEKKHNTVWRHLNGFGFLGAKIQETVILIAVAPVVWNVDVKLQNWCCLIQSAAKIIHIITHECKWSRWNHKSLRFPIVLYLWKVYGTKKKKKDLTGQFYFPFKIISTKINSLMSKCTVG